jgi:predicted transcriptional regulator of viral defense system
MKKRPLGTIESKLLTTLASRNKNIFSIADAQEVVGSTYIATKLLVNGLVEKSWLFRLIPGKYLIVPLSAGEEAEFTGDWFVVGKYLIAPAQYYFSYYSALVIHEMTTQPVMTVYTSTPKRRKKTKVLGATYQNVYTNPGKIWGIEEVWVKPTEKVRVSDLERTIIDCLNNPKLCGGISELAKGIWIKRDEINFERLLSYAERFNSKAVIKRLGFLLELFDLSSEIQKKLKEKATSTFVLLDPSLPSAGKYQSKWHLRINLNPEELKESTKT